MSAFKRGDYVLWPAYSGIVFTYRGPAIERRHPEIFDDEDQPTGEYDMSEVVEIEDHDHALVVMVGDDQLHTAPVDELRPFNGHPCSCGQVGCHEEITDEGDQ